MKNILLFLPLIMISCGVIPIDKSTYKSSHSTIELGAIGNYNSKLIDKKFQINALLQLNKKVRVGAVLNSFDKSSIKTYNKFHQKNSHKIITNDSSNIQKKYIQLNILDKVALIEEINASHNKSIFEYLKVLDKPQLITSIAINFSNEIQNKIVNAEELILINSENKKNILELYNKGKLTDIIHFSNGILFEYETSSFCWGENNQQDIVITNIPNKGCLKNNYKTYKKASKRKKEFKF